MYRLPGQGWLDLWPDALSPVGSDELVSEVNV